MKLLRLSEGVDVSSFDCGENHINEFLHNSEKYHNQGLSSVNCLVAKENSQLIGFYAIAPSSIPKKLSTELLSDTIEFPIPCWLLGMLGIDNQFKGNKKGEALLLYAIHDICCRAANGAGAGIYVDAINEQVVDFYKKYGFKDLKNKTRKLFLPIDLAFELVGHVTTSTS